MLDQWRKFLECDRVDELLKILIFRYNPDVSGAFTNFSLSL